MSIFSIDENESDVVRELPQKDHLDKEHLKSKFSTEQQDYFIEVGAAVSNNYTKKAMEVITQMMGIFIQTNDTSELIVNQKKVDAIFTTGTIFGTQKKVLIPGKGRTYILVISGDEALLRSSELDRFFESFRIVE